MADGSSGVRILSHQTLHIEGYDLQHIKIDENEDIGREGRDDWRGREAHNCGNLKQIANHIERFALRLP
jgi:hypothetical protein